MPRATLRHYLRPGVHSVRRSRRVPVAVALALSLATGSALAIHASAAPSANTAGPQFTVTNGLIVATKRTPVPASHTEAYLPWGHGSASTTLTGGGPLTIQAEASQCLGTPHIAVYVDGKRLSDLALGAATNYIKYIVQTGTAQGTHAVKLVFLDDLRVVGSCDRNVHIGSVSMATIAPAVAPAVNRSAFPNASDTGVPDGTNLRVENGDITVRTAGTVIDGVDLRGRIYVQANNVTIKNSIIRGGAAPSSSAALISSFWGNTGLLIQDTTLLPTNLSPHLDGIGAANFTANRVDISKVVDPIKIIGNNSTVTNSWLHDNAHWNNDPNQSDGQTHDDGIQIEGGTNILIQGNNIPGGHNSAIMVTQNHAKTGNLKITGNFLAGGACTINISQQGAGTPILGSSITKNAFGLSRYANRCPMRLPNSSPIYRSGNYWLSNLLPVVPVLF